MILQATPIWVELLDHPLILEIAGLILAAIGTLIARKYNRAKFKKVFAQHTEFQKSKREMHEELLNTIGADQVIILKASNGGAMPSARNEWKISIKKMYEIDPSTGIAENIVEDWQGQYMEDEYWDMVTELLNKKVMFFPKGAPIPSKRLEDSHKLYNIEAFILTKLYYKRKFFPWEKTEVWFARWGYHDGEKLKMQDGEPIPEISIPIHNRRGTIAELWK